MVSLLYTIEISILVTGIYYSSTSQFSFLIVLL